MPGPRRRGPPRRRRLGHAAGHQRESQRADADDRPDSFLAQLRVGAVLAQQGQFAAAEPYLRQAKRLFPEYAGPDSPYLLLARLHAERGEQRAAIQELSTLVTLSDRHLEARLWLADMLQSEGATEAAAAALESAFMIDVDRPEELRRVAELHAEAGNWVAAVRARRALLGLDPVDRAGAYYELARAQMEAGDLAGARRSVLGALELAPSYPAAQELLLELRARRGDTS